jgi:glycosyltransferase involved in cell wall biosynthesis
MNVTLAVVLVAWVIALVWVWKAVEALRGMPRVPNLLLPEFDVWPAGEPRVTVLVPARDEAGDVAACLMSLVAQDYSNLNIIAIDDRSSDATGVIMDELAARESERLSVLHVAELPEGWLGKTHAMAMGARQAIAMHQPEYLLFTDADVIFQPQAIRRALAQAVGTRADHFVLVPSPILRTAGETALLGFMQVMGLLAVRPWRVADARARDAIGVGGFNLMRVNAYEALGGFEALRMQIVEDVVLARRVKRVELRQRVAFAPGMVTLHWAAGAMGVVKGVTKNMFAVFGFRPGLLLGACLGLVLFWLGPLAGLFYSGTWLPAVLTLAAIATMYGLMRRMGGIPVWTAVAFPFSVVLFLYSMLRSMVVTLRAGGVTWRGTFYPLAELRRNVERLQ